MAHDDQFTATGPPLAGSGFPRSGFSTRATGMVYGLNVQGNRCGVYGESVTVETNRESTVEGVGVHGFGQSFGVSGNGNPGVAGVYGQNNRGRIGTIGAVMRGGAGVVGASLENLGNPLATWQTVPSADMGGSGTGVWGISGTGDGTRGDSVSGVGVRGTSRTMTGVRGTSSTSAGVEGISDSGAGVQGISGSGDGVKGGTNRGTGVHGICSIQGIGVFAENFGSGGMAVAGQSTTGAIGVYGLAVGPAAAVLGLNGSGPAGVFLGKVEVAGDLTVSTGTKSFKIDHPLDPENRYLLHTCVESSERKNVYDGVTQLDVDGATWVELPEWFEALNDDFRYQLTAIGGAAPDLHVAEEISENRFKIAGGQEGMKVCWQVTGSRKDPWAVANPFEIEQEKPQEDRGRYLQPDLYDAPQEQKIEIVPVQAAAGLAERLSRPNADKEPVS